MALVFFIFHSGPSTKPQDFSIGYWIIAENKHNDQQKFLHLLLIMIIFMNFDA